jgi:arylsulfatase A-like enzyme
MDEDDGDISFSLPKLREPLNVVLFFLETTRSDMMPFNYSSPFAKNHLSRQTLKEKRITPFMDRIAAKGFHIPFMRTVNAYTIKSMFSSLCSIYGFPAHGNSEWAKNIPVKCLPKLLREAGYQTAAIQSTEMNFDHQLDLMKKLGFRERISKEVIEKRDIDGSFDWLTYFGYADQVAKPFVFEWLDRAKREGTPFFMSYLTSTTHHPYLTPKSWETKIFTLHADNEFNRYFNALNYVDAFLDDLFVGFRERGIMEDTIFAFVGDHGLSLRDHDDVYDVHAVPYEEAYRVPFILYTENEMWRDKLRYRGEDTEFRTTLDILPTILDILGPEGFDGESLASEGYEGYSVFGPYREVPKYSHGNPGDHTVSLLYEGKKILRNSDNSDMIFDIAADPHEMSPWTPYNLPPELKSWYVENIERLEKHLADVHALWGVMWKNREKYWPYYNYVLLLVVVGIALAAKARVKPSSFFLEILYHRIVIPNETNLV